MYWLYWLRFFGKEERYSVTVERNGLVNHLVYRLTAYNFGNHSLRWMAVWYKDSLCGPIKLIFGDMISEFAYCELRKSTQTSSRADGVDVLYSAV